MPVALITGSTSGIGWSLAQEFAEAGYAIVLNGFEGDTAITELCQSLEAQGASVLYSDADMRVPAQITAMMAQAASHFGVVDVLINNAGIQHVAAIQDFPAAKWQEILDINLTSAFHTIKAAIPMMQQNGRGRIINIASAHGLVASPYKSAYVAAKHGLLGLTKTVALELAEQNITCNAICPGYVKTPLVEAQIPATARERDIPESEVISEVMLKNQPTKAFVASRDIAALALYLCGDRAGSITGAALNVDGGWCAQ